MFHYKLHNTSNQTRVNNFVFSCSSITFPPKYERDVGFKKKLLHKNIYHKNKIFYTNS